MSKKEVIFWTCIALAMIVVTLLSLSITDNLDAEPLDIELRKNLIDHTPSIWPTWGKVTSLFGERRPGHIHRGLDIANDTGTPVYATADGIVIFSDWYGGFGKKVTIYHSLGLWNSRYTTVYAHLDEIYVDKGNMIKRGDMIGTMGNTGNSTGPHLHYEVLVDGINVDPKLFLP